MFNNNEERLHTTIIKISAIRKEVRKSYTRLFIRKINKAFLLNTTTLTISLNIYYNSLTFVTIVQSESDRVKLS